MADKIFPEGIRAFSKHDKAPEFVKGVIVITPNDLFAWLKKNENLLTEYEGKKQIKLQILEGGKGLYLQVDTYKANQQASNETSDIPF